MLCGALLNPRVTSVSSPWNNTFPLFFFFLNKEQCIHTDNKAGFYVPFRTLSTYPLPLLYITSTVAWSLKQKPWSSTQHSSVCVFVSCCCWQPALRLTNLTKSMIPETVEAQNFPSTFSVKTMDTQALGNLQTVLNFLGDMKFTVLINWYSWCNYTNFSHIHVRTCCVFQFYAILRWTWTVNKPNIAVSDHWFYVCIWIFENN